MLRVVVGWCFQCTHAHKVFTFGSHHVASWDRYCKWAPTVAARADGGYIHFQTLRFSENRASREWKKTCAADFPPSVVKRGLAATMWWRKTHFFIIFSHTPGNRLGLIVLLPNTLFQISARLPRLGYCGGVHVGRKNQEIRFGGGGVNTRAWPPCAVGGPDWDTKRTQCCRFARQG